jgi:hypothetical protein
VTQELRDTEQVARSTATAVLAKSHCEGVRVVKKWQRADGTVTENVIFSQTAAPQEAKVTIVAIEDAPVCQRTDDYYRPESRATMNRLLRKYFEKVVLTPSELIHSHQALRKFQQMDMLFTTAVDRVATVQAANAGLDSRARREEIFQTVARMTQRARQAEQHPNLPVMKGRNFETVLARVEKVVKPAEVEFSALVVLSRDLAEQRSWLGKLARLVELIGSARRSEALLDGVIADVFGVPAALQDILGDQPNLAEALCALVDLYEGKVPASNDAAEQLAVLAPLLGGDRLKETRQALMDRLVRQLAGSQPLNRHDPSGEREAFRRVASRLFRSSNLLGGPATAEALTRRSALLLEEGGKTALNLAVGEVFSIMTDPLFRTVYLLELAESRLGPELSAQIVRLLGQTLRVRRIDNLVPQSWPANDKLLCVTRFYLAIADCAVVPEANRPSLLGLLDALLTDCLKRERIVERLDDPDLPLHSRAVRLLEFCAAGLLPPKSGALGLAREHVIELLRQPNFELKLMQGVADPSGRETTLRELHALMARAGFG